MHLLATKLFLCMAVIRKKWWYGFKPAKEVPVCRTGPLQTTSDTQPTLAATADYKQVFTYFSLKCFGDIHMVVLDKNAPLSAQISVLEYRMTVSIPTLSPWTV